MGYNTIGTVEGNRGSRVEVEESGGFFKVVEGGVEVVVLDLKMGHGFGHTVHARTVAVAVREESGGGDAPELEHFDSEE